MEERESKRRRTDDGNDSEPRPGPSTGNGDRAPRPGPSTSHDTGDRARPGPSTSHDTGDRARPGPSTRRESGDRAQPGTSTGREGGRKRPPLQPALKTRPASALNSKKGTSGDQIRLKSNHFQLHPDRLWILHKHSVEFEPPEDRTFAKKSMLRHHRNRFVSYLFDGSTLFTTREACDRENPLVLESPSPSVPGMTKITIKYVGTCEPSDYQYFQVFNIILRECLSYLNLKLMRRNYYDPTAGIQVVNYKLELWPGYITSIAQYESDILLQCELHSKVLRTQTALQLLEECRHQRDFRVAFTTAIVGQVVMTVYNKETYRIDHVDFGKNPSATFHLRKQNVETTYIDYYKNKYGVQINNPTQPLLVSRSNARARRAGRDEHVLLVPELCTLTGLTDEMRGNFQLMRTLAQHTNLAPTERRNRLMTFSRRLTTTPEVESTLQGWGLRLNPELVDVPGRSLPMERIVVADRQTHDAGPEADWTRTLRASALLLNVELRNWVVVYPDRCERDARSFCDMLSRVGHGMRFNIPQPNRKAIRDDHPASYVYGLEDAINNYNPQLVVCVVPNNRSDRYNAIKKKCILQKPIPSQIVQIKSINNRGSMSICTKIAIQINCKVGGAPWSVSIPVSHLMVIGFDSCRDPTDRNKSYSGMVATLDNTYARYYSSIAHNAVGEEVSTTLGMNVLKAIDRYDKRNNAIPKLIVIYRDGVGEGSLRQVYEEEVQNLKRTLQPIYARQRDPKLQKLRLAFVVVTKKGNTRLFYGDRNPSPGTVVDDVITDPLKYDFYLVSQTVRQGTVMPTHYNVLEDTTGLQPDHLQRLTYKFTHLYFNWSGTVRVPAPCQYAKKLAQLTASSVGEAHTNLDQLLYFL